MKVSRRPWGVRSMRARMTALFALLVALLMVGVSLGVTRLERKRAETRADEDLHLAVERARSELGEEDERGKPFLEVLQDEQGEIAAGGLTLLVVQGDQVLWRSRSESPNWPKIDPAWKWKTLASGPQTLIVARPWAADKEELSERERELTALSLLIVAATAALAWIVVGQTLSPIVRLADQAQNATLQGFSARLHAPSSDAEIRHLTATLNALLSHLENEAKSRGRFYAAASHELRTPLQVLLGQIDVALARPRTVQQHEATLQELGMQTERLAELVASLLQLNALEMGQMSAVREVLPLSYWVERALDQQTQAIERRGLTVATHLKDVLVEAPSAHIEMLLRNLLENAVKYATPHTSIEVELKEEAHCAVFCVSNRCDLVAEADPMQWFEPFFRDDTSRSSQTGGNGLGLSIVAALARANAWEVELRVKADTITASVRFPLLIEENGVDPAQKEEGIG